MASAFTGMSELIRGLGRMGETVQREAGGITRTAAQIHLSRVVSRYPRKTGTLANRVVMEQISPMRFKVKSKAPHAFIFESGSLNRRIHSTGANRGRMPAANIFKPEAQRVRAGMVQQLVALVERQTVPNMTGRLEVRER